jgi:tetratricopeptide (TPR) repeat protein
VPLDTLSPADRFARWVEADTSGSLLTKVGDLPFEHAKFLIDAPVDPAEFEWAAKNVKLTRTTFAKAFSSINYDRDRLDKQAYVWPGEKYTLANINSDGGICVDQAYFAMIAGKARGLPTLYFSGQGADGGHAWFGYLKAPDRWELDCGRYENQNYAVGEALDPQTWTPINDHELEFLTTGLKRSPTYPASMDDLLVAGWFERDGDLASAARAYDSAVITCPANPAGWDAKSAFLERTGATATVRRKHHEAALKQFTNQRDRRVIHQTALAKIAAESGDATTAAAMQSKIIAQNKSSRSDLGVAAASERVMASLSNGPIDAAMKDYRKALDDLGAKGGGNLFYDLVAPFVSALAEKGHIQEAREALILARKALQPGSDSILDRAFLRTEARLNQPEQAN